VCEWGVSLSFFQISFNRHNHNKRDMADTKVISLSILLSWLLSFKREEKQNTTRQIYVE